MGVFIKCHLIFVPLFAGFFVCQTVFADVTVEFLDTVQPGTAKVTHYISASKMRIDSVSQKSTKITIIDENNIIDCNRPKNATAKGSCSVYPVNKMQALLSGMTGEKGLVKVTSYSVKPLGKAGTFAGRHCDYFRRDMKTTGFEGSTTSMSETFCIDRTLAKEVNHLVEKFLNPWLSQIQDPNLRRSVLRDEKNVVGISLFREVWTTMNLSSNLKVSKPKPQPFVDKKVQGQMDRLSNLQQEFQKVASKPMKGQSETATKLILGPISAKIFQIPTDQFEILKSSNSPR